MLRGAVIFGNTDTTSTGFWSNWLPIMDCFITRAVTVFEQKVSQLEILQAMAVSKSVKAMCSFGLFVVRARTTNILCLKHVNCGACGQRLQNKRPRIKVQLHKQDLSIQTIFFIHVLQYPTVSVVRLKNFCDICSVIWQVPSGITYCESVFRKSFSENVEVFLGRRMARNNTHFRIDTCGRAYSVPRYPISIRVWGIVSFISTRVFPQPSER